MNPVFLTGPSHVTRWTEEIAKGRLPAMPRVTLWGEGGLALFAARLRDNIERQAQAGKDIWLIVPDFRFGIEFFRDHVDFSKTGPFVNGYGMINRTMITPERDAILFENGIRILDHYARQYGRRIKFVFWCLAVREYRNRQAGKYLDARGHYRHPLWNYQDMLARYPGNTVDIWPMTQDFDGYTVDQQGHPSVRAMAFIYHACRLGNGQAAFDLVSQRYPAALEALFAGEAGQAASTVATGIQAFEGRSGWLFLAGDSNRGMDQHYGRLTLGPDQLAATRLLLEQRKSWLDARRIKHLTFIAPDKNVVYADRLPDATPPSPNRPGQQYLQVARELGLNVVYALDDLLDARKRGFEVYDAIDTHWNGLGAYVGYEDLVAAIQSQGLPVGKVPPTSLVCEQTFLRGGLGIKMQPERLGAAVTCRVGDARSRLVFDNGIVNRGNLNIYECETAAPVKAVMFGDSFHLALLPYLAESFRRLVFVHRSDLDYELIERERPDLVIVESVERFLAQIPPEHARLPTSEIVLEKLKRLPPAEIGGVVKRARQGLEAAASSTEAAFHLGLALLAANRFDEASRAFASAATLGDWPLARRYLGIALYEAGDFARARESLAGSPVAGLDELMPSPVSMSAETARAGIEFDPDWAVPHHHLGRILLAAKDHDTAERHQVRAVALMPGSSAAYYRLGQILVARSQDSSAEAVFRCALALVPNAPAYWMALGQCRLRQGDAGGAHEAYREAIRLEPHRADHYTAEGVAMMRSGDLEGAHRAFSEAIRLDPRHEGANVQAGVVLKKLGRTQEAMSAFRSALSINPGNRGAAYELAHLLVAAERLQEAETGLEKALTLHPSDTEMKLLMARIQARFKRFDQARQFVADVLGVNPEHKQARHQLETINRLSGEAAGPAQQAA